jgi:hypothetical protein
MHVFLAEGVSTFDFCEIEGITPTSLARGRPINLADAPVHPRTDRVAAPASQPTRDCVSPTPF